MEGPNLASVRISKEAEVTIKKMLEIVNKDYSGGRITKSELISWILIQFEKEYFKAALPALQKEYFDPLIYLDSIVKKAKADKASGKQMPDMTLLLEPLVAKGPSGQDHGSG